MNDELFFYAQESHTIRRNQTLSVKDTDFCIHAINLQKCWIFINLSAMM